MTGFPHKEREDHEAREYLIRKDGYYYRPNCQGYTTRKVEAGRYTIAEADREAAVEPWHMSAIHQDEIPDEPEIVDRDARIAALERENAELQAKRDKWLRKAGKEFAKSCELADRALATEALMARLSEALNQIDALDPEGHVSGCSPDALRGLVIRMGEIARAALSGSGAGGPVE